VALAWDPTHRFVASCLVRNPGPVPALETANRSLGRRPIWDIGAIQRLALAQQVRAATLDAGEDIQRMGWTISQLCTFISTVEKSHYANSVWARTSNAMWLPCDAFRFRSGPFPGGFVPTAQPFYLKLSIHAPKTSGVVMLCSCHS
jgi:hypothetical protein